MSRLRPLYLSSLELGPENGTNRWRSIESMAHHDGKHRRRPIVGALNAAGLARRPQQGGRRVVRRDVGPQGCSGKRRIPQRFTSNSGAEQPNASRRRSTAAIDWNSCRTTQMVPAGHGIATILRRRPWASARYGPRVSRVHGDPRRILVVEPGMSWPPADHRAGVDTPVVK
jgi:hypothetical protein